MCLQGAFRMKNDEKGLMIGSRLKELRRDRRMSQLTAAKALGMTQSWLSQLESGRRSVSAAAVVRFAELYGVTPADIYGAGPRETVLVNGNELLDKLVESSSSEKLKASVEVYTALSLYRIFRAVYMLNPHNTGELFSVSEQEADRLTAAFLRDEPHRIGTLRLADRAQRSDIELPPEMADELRAFIRSCESLLLRNDSKTKP